MRELARNLVWKVPLPQHTINGRIDHIALNLNEQLIEEINDTELQLDGATDSTKDAHLIFYVRFLNDNIIIEDFLLYV